MELTRRERMLVVIGFKNGYETGHNDTVESQYGDALECGVDWLNDATEDGGLEYDVEKFNEIYPHKYKEPECQTT